MRIVINFENHDDRLTMVDWPVAPEVGDFVAFNDIDKMSVDLKAEGVCIVTQRTWFEKDGGVGAVLHVAKAKKIR
jgi:hypothetical protein